ncbi:MAG: phosphatase PAP2 family protein [Bacteroidia bacterium]|nr:phosphatase PAP2 family protein [Bacteroidia bacterium]
MANDQSGSRSVLAKTISYVFHPLLIPTIGLWFIFNSRSYISFIITPELQNALYVVVFIATFVFPVLSSILLLIMGRIKSLEMESPEERRIPYLLTAIYYSLGYYMLTTKVPLPEQINLILLGANISVVLTMLINIKWKISAHTIGIGGLIGTLLGFGHQLQVNVINELILAFLIAGLIGYARLRLHAHTQSQVYVGYLVGFLCEFLLFVFL